MRLLADFSSQTGIVGNAQVFGSQGAPNSLSTVPTFINNGFVFERYGLAIYNVVPQNITLADYKANKNNVQNASTWNYGYLQKLSHYQNSNPNFRFMLTLAYPPAWLTFDNTTTGVPSDMAVWSDIVMKISLYLKQFASVRYIEVWNEPGGQFLTIRASPYVNHTAAYMEIYYHTVQGVRAAGLSADIGGPAAGSLDLTLVDAMLSNSSISGDIAFLSFHSYDNNLDVDASNLAALRAVAGTHGRSSIPVFLTEWNYAYYVKTLNDPLNSRSTDAISYVGRRLTNMLQSGYAGASIFTMSAPLTNDTTMMGLNGLYLNNTFTPKAQTFRLMSSILGLGLGSSQIMRTIFNSAVITTTVAAINSADSTAAGDAPATVRKRA
ncbi:MAG: hypothetical protein WDW36_005956 [Sanguina aurantia]